MNDEFESEEYSTIIIKAINSSFNTSYEAKIGVFHLTNRLQYSLKSKSLLEFKVEHYTGVRTITIPYEVLCNCIISIYETKP